MNYKGNRLIKSIAAGVLVLSVALTANATNLQNQKDQIEDERNEAVAEQQSLEARVNSLTRSMKQAEADIAAKRAEIEATEEELLQAKIDENSQYESMKTRIRYMYENNNVNMIQLFMESDNLTEFLTTAEYITKMSEYDRDKLDEFSMTVRAVEEKELQLQAEYQKLSDLQETIAAQRKEAQHLLDEKSSELANLNDQLKDIRNQIKKAEEEAKRQQPQEPANSSSNQPSNNTSTNTSKPKPPVVTGNGRFTHPCPALKYISSTFSEVREDVGNTAPHKGVDFAANAGTPIYAADAGKVLYARWSDSAGYWVVIDHGDGLVTKYMHMYQHPSVSEGARVVKGQYLGGVGNTGNSYGNHLHFQVELNGKAVDPMKYL